MTTSAHVKNEFYIVDFDWTLADTDKLNEVFFEIVEQYHAISRNEIVKAREDVQRTGDSFDTAGYVRDRLYDEGRGEEWADLEKRYIHESRALNYLMPGAAELLEWLAAHGKRYGILTYGNPLWQRLKLTAAGFNHVRHIITEQKEKGKFVHSWQRHDESFRIPDALGGGSAESIVMIDDKAVSFDHFPSEPSHGYWVLNPEHELLPQQGTVPANVTRYKNLLELVPEL